MLVMGQKLLNKRIMSLRIGRPIGIVDEPIINPYNLKIEGWHATDLGTKQPVILLSQDIRDIIAQGFVVNDHESLSDPNELIRLRKVLEHNFILIGKNVFSGRRKLGRVSDYAFEKNSAFIQKLYVNQSIIKSFSGGISVIDRSQIIEITHKKIVVKEATINLPAKSATAKTRTASAPA